MSIKHLRAPLLKLTRNLSEPPRFFLSISGGLGIKLGKAHVLKKSCLQPMGWECLWSAKILD